MSSNQFGPQDDESRRPSFGLPGPSQPSANGGEPDFSGSASHPSASGEGFDGFSGSMDHQFGQSSASQFGSSAPASGAGSSAHGFGQSSASQFGQNSTSPFGQYAPAHPDHRMGPTGLPTGGPGGPRKKQKPVGIILTIIGGVLTLASIAMFIVSLVMFGNSIGSMADQFAGDTVNGSAVSGGESSYTVKTDGMAAVMPAVATKDLSTASCTAVDQDGNDIAPQTDSNTETIGEVGGVEYSTAKQAFFSEDGSSMTVTCSGVTEPIMVIGPVGIGSFMGAGGLLLGAIGVGLLGVGLLIAGIIVMIVRAAGRSKAAA